MAHSYGKHLSVGSNTTAVDMLHNCSRGFRSFQVFNIFLCFTGFILKRIKFTSFYSDSTTIVKTSVCRNYCKLTRYKVEQKQKRLTSNLTSWIAKFKDHLIQVHKICTVFCYDSANSPIWLSLFWKAVFLVQHSLSVDKQFKL